MGWIFGGWPPPPPGAGGAIDIGDPVGGGTPPSVLFIDAAGKLAQDPGRFGYDKTKHTLLFGRNDVEPIISVPSTEFTYGVPLNLIATEFGFPNAINDPVMRWGFNLSRGGGPVVAGKAALGIEFEGSAPRNDDPTKAQTEFHVVSIDALGNIFRVFDSFMFHDGTFIKSGMSGDAVGLNDRAGNPLFDLNTTLSPTRARVLTETLEVDGAVTGPLRFRQGANAVPSGITAEADNQLLDFGVNSSRFGTQVDADPGAVLFVDGGAGHDDTYLFTYRAATVPGDVATVALINRFGAARFMRGFAPAAGGNAGLGLFLGNTNMGILFGSGAPGIAAKKGSVYMRSDGTGANDRAYVATDDVGGWTAFVTVA